MNKTNAMRMLDRAGIPYRTWSYDHGDGKIDGLSVGRQPLDGLIREAARMICALCGHPVDDSEQQEKGESST